MAASQYKFELPFGGSDRALVSVVMGSRSDWEPCMQHACALLEKLGIPFEVGVVSRIARPTSFISMRSMLKIAASPSLLPVPAVPRISRVSSPV